MRVVPSANEAATARIGYSSIMVGARSGGTSTPLSVDVRTRRSATSSPPSLRRSSTSIVRAHFPQRGKQSGPQRIEHDAVEHDLGARHDQRRDQRKRRRRRIGRHHHRRGHELRLAGERDPAAVGAERLDPDLGAEMRQHFLGMIAGRLALDHRGGAGAASPASSTADLSWAEGTGASYSIGIGSRAPCKPSAAAGRPRRSPERAHPFAPAGRERAASAACAGWRRRRRSRRSDSPRPRPSSGGSRCRNCRNRAARPAPPGRRPRHRGCARRRRPVRSTVAPSARMTLAVSRTSSPSSSPLMRVSPTASAPKISERDARSTCRPGPGGGP